MIYCVVNANYLDSLIKVSQNKIKLARQNQKKRQEIEENLIKTLKEIGQSEQDKSRLISDQELQELYTKFKTISDTDFIIFESWLAGKPVESMGDPQGTPIDSLNEYYNNTRNYLNFIDSAYGESSAKDIMLRKFNSGIVRSIIVDIANNREVIGDAVTLNNQITQLKEDLYLEVKKYVEAETGETLPDTLFEAKNNTNVRENIGLNAINNLIRNGSSEMQKLYTLSQEPRVLSTWKNKLVGSNETYSTKLNGYNAYFILNHFDDLLADQFGDYIIPEGGEINHMSSELTKYVFNDKSEDDSNTNKTWQQEDLLERSAYDLIPKHMQRFLESLEIKDSNGKGTNQYLTKNHLTYFIKQIKRDLRANNRTVIDIVQAEKYTDEQLFDIIDEQFDYKLPSEVVSDLVEQIKKENPDRFQHKSLSFSKIVNNLRTNQELVLKTIFELRDYEEKAGNLPFNSKMEERLFRNLYNYLFARDKSLYSSSRHLFRELSQLFDTMSVVDHSQYRLTENGHIEVRSLSPEGRDQIKENRKRRINTRFLPRSMKYYTDKYGGTLINETTVTTGTTNTSTKRLVEFGVKGADGRVFWKFTYSPRTDSWTLQRRSSKDLEKFETYSPKAVENGKVAERAKLTTNDLVGLNEFIDDIIGFDFYHSPEQWEALLDITNKTNAVRTTQRDEELTKQALTTLLDICVRIYSNALIFRQSEREPVLVGKDDKVQVNREYILKDKDISYYTTQTNEPYTISRKTKDDEVITSTDEAKLEKLIGNRRANFIKQEELQQMIQEQYGNLYYGQSKQYQLLINDWYGEDKKDQLRTNIVYQGVDVVPSKVSTEYMEDLVELEALLTGSTFKNQVDTAERTKITIGNGSMLFYESPSRLQDQGRHFTDPMTILHDYLKQGLVKREFSREVDNKPEVKQNKDLNFKENFYSCFVADYLLPRFMKGDKYRGQGIRFTDTVNSDKPNVPKITIANGQIMTFDTAKKHIKNALGDAYRACFVNIQKDFKDLCREYNKYRTDKVTISLEDNYDSFNEWCSRHEISPIEQLGQMVMEYNNAHRNKPLALYEGTHYTIGKDKKFYINQTFAESLIRFGDYTWDQYNERISDLETLKKNLKNELNSYEKYELVCNQLDNLNRQIPDFEKWKVTINNIRERYKANLSPDANKTIFEANSNINYDQFIEYSNLHLLYNLLSHDVVLDMKGLEGEMQLLDCRDKIIAGMDETEADQWNARWLTYQSDRMALGYLKVKNEETGLFEDTVEPIQNRDKDKAQRPIQIVSRVDLHGLYNKTADGKIISNTDPKFRLTKTLYKVIDGVEREVQIEINPLLLEYNLNHYYWTSLSNLAVTGSHAWSDAKGASRTLDEESAKWFDNNKRAVINSATATQYVLGNIWGVPTEANIAVIDDIRAICSGIYGDTPKVKPYDGATFVNPLMYYWENTSLNGQVTGLTKKPIYGAYDERTMVGILIKTASFAFTNDEMLNSPWTERAMWKMTNHRWINQQGKYVDVDLTLGLSKWTEIGYAQNEKGQTEGYTVVPGITGRLSNEGKEIEGLSYYDQFTEKQGDKYVFKREVKEIIGFRKLYRDESQPYSNYYEIVTQSRDAHTHELIRDAQGKIKTTTQYRTINSNYSFWKVLGGQYSVKWNPTLRTYENSENSIKAVADIACKVRFKNGVQDLYTQEQEYRASDKFTQKEKDITTQDNRFWDSPMKNSDIHYIVTKGAIKKGAANVNTVKSYFNDEQLNFYKIKLTQAGIQLDPEHEADQSEVSLMTQVISGLADRGYTSQMADEVYKALGNLSELATKESYSAFLTAFNEGDRQKIQEIVSNLLIDELAQSKSNSRVSNLAKALAEPLIQKRKRGETLTFNDIKDAFAFSDGSIFELLQTTVTSAINKKAIREKMFGSLSVLRPSHEIHKIYGTKRLEELQDFTEVIALQKRYAERRLDSISQTEIGRYYRVVGGKYDGQLINLIDSDYYYLWKARLAGETYQLEETIYDFDPNIIDCTDLEGARNFIKNNSGQFNFYVLTYSNNRQIIRRIADVNEFRNLSSANLKSIQKINLYGRNLGSENIHMNLTSDTPTSINRYDLSAVQDSRYREIKNKVNDYLNKNGILVITEETWDNILLTNEGSLAKKDLWKEAYYSQIDNLDEHQAEKLLQDQLNAIDTGRTLQYYDSTNTKQDGRVANYKVIHFEAILPMIYATQFGIRKGDTLAKILQDKNFFFKRNLENYLLGQQPDESTYDVCIKRADGKHIYVKQGNPRTLEDKGLKELRISIFKDADDKLFRVNKYKRNSKMYALSSNQDKVYYDSINKNEVIVTDNLAFYIEHLNYTGLHFSKNAATSQIQELVLRGLEDSTNSVGKFLRRTIKKNGIASYISSQNNLIQNIKTYLTSSDKKTAIENLKALNNKIITSMANLSEQQYASFVESLKFTVARIPAQGMQSFMAMDIVGFNNTGVHDCYVSAEQIRLQGSDYDVDKATFLGHAFTKSGVFVKWSNYFKMNTHKDLVRSKVLPFPTGTAGSLIKSNQNSIDFSKYYSLIYDPNTEGKEASQETNEAASQEKEDSSNTSTKYKLKYYRNQKLLAQLINEVNDVAETYLKEHPSENSFEIQYSDEKEKDKVQALIDVVNSHNLYVRRMSIENRSDALKNFIASRTFSISEHPANALVGQTSVDVVSQPLKDLSDVSNCGNKPTESRPGDFSIQLAALEQNFSGKDVIGITASNGVKCYFAISQVINNAIRKNRDLSKYKFNVNFINRKTGEQSAKHFIANPFLDINTDLPEEQQLSEFSNRLSNSGLSQADKEWLYNRYKDQIEWADSWISGILSLATDNAKELRLDQLNAGKDLAGLYLYGVQIGIPIREIFDTMTSTTARVLSRIMKTNIFGYDDIARSLDAAIDFINEDKTNTAIMSSARYITENVIKITQESLKKLNLDIEGLDYNHTRGSLFSFKDMSSKDSIIKIIQDGNFDKYLKRLKYIRNNLLTFKGNIDRSRKESTGDNTFQRGYSYEQIQLKRNLDKYIHYAYDIYEIYTSNAREEVNLWADLNNIKTLSQGFSELGVLRGLLGLNQGIKTKSADKLKFYEDFSQILNNRYKQLGKRTRERIDFLRFFTDKQYQQDIINQYDEIKHTINPLRIVLELPHFRAYLRGAFVDYAMCSISAKFRLMTQEILPIINDEFRPENKVQSDRYIRRSLDFIDSIITNRWLSEQKPILIPKGNMKVDAQGNLTPSKTDFYIELGNDAGNATFIDWMNNEVIPRLKEGKAYGPNVSFGMHINTKGSNDAEVNTFLRDLSTNITNKTSDRNNTNVYTLQIDMIPKSDTEADKLSMYKSDFNELNYMKYQINNSEGYNIVDLLFYYNLINFRNKGDNQSLTGLLETLVQTRRNQTISSYFSFVSQFDREYDIKPGQDFAIDDLQRMIAPTTTEIRPARAGSRRIPYLWDLDKDTMKYTLYRYVGKDEEAPSGPMSRMTREGYKEVETSKLSIYPQSFEAIDNLEPNKPIQIKMANLETQVTLKFDEKNNPELEVHDTSIISPDGKSHTYDLRERIKGNDLLKLLKVNNNNGRYEYKVNPTALLIYIAAKRRVDNNVSKLTGVEELKKQVLKNPSKENTALFYATVDRWINEYGRLPYADEFPVNVGADSLEVLKDKLGLTGSKNKFGVQNDRLYEYTGKNNPEEIGQVLGDLHRDYNFTVIDIDGKESILEVEKRPTEDIKFIDPIPNMPIAERAVGHLLDRIRTIHGINIHEVQDKDVATIQDFPNAVMYKGFVRNGEIFVNTDHATPDTNIHELMHIFIGGIRFQNPYLYQNLLEMATKDPELPYKLSKFNHRTQTDKLEEVTIEEISKYLIGRKSIFSQLSQKDKYELDYYLKRLLDTMLNGDLSVKIVQENQLYNSTLAKVARIVNSREIFNNMTGTMSESFVHRVLNNQKQSLLKSGELKEQC